MGKAEVYLRTDATAEGEAGWMSSPETVSPALVFEEFTAEFCGKVSPVHLFWHSFDLAVTRFSGRRVDQPAGVDGVTREAYSREVISAGFWFGDETLDQPGFYSYTAPEPDGLTEEQLRPLLQNGPSPVLGTLRCCATTTPALPLTRGPPFWTSCTAPTMPERVAPDGTSAGWPARAASPTRCSAPGRR
jgi:hypothetical protein